MGESLTRDAIFIKGMAISQMKTLIHHQSAKQLKSE